MEITMHTIKAGPDGCSDAGETINVSPEVGQRLIDGKFAIKAMRRVPGRETAMIDPETLERQEREKSEREQREKDERETSAKTRTSVLDALSQFNPAEDDDWTSKGKPSMDRVKTLTGSRTLTRSELDAMFPEFQRPEQTVNSPATPPPASGVRSNKP